MIRHIFAEHLWNNQYIIAATANIDNDQTDDSEKIEPKENRKNQQTMEINYLFITHMKSDLNHSNETCIKSIKMVSKIQM